MNEYAFVNKEAISSMDKIANSVKDEIINMTKKRETYFTELR